MKQLYLIAVLVAVVTLLFIAHDIDTVRRDISDVKSRVKEVL